jgi:hypothetical protein
MLLAWIRMACYVNLNLSTEHMTGYALPLTKQSHSALEQRGVREILRRI